MLVKLVLIGASMLDAVAKGSDDMATLGLSVSHHGGETRSIR
jgi:hypothetical protein